MKYKKYLLAMAALVLVAVTAVPVSMAYFTDTESAQGGFQVSLGDISHEPRENVEGMTKMISIDNTGDYPVFVRVKAEAPDGVNVAIADGTDSGWTLKDDGYYYYSEVVEAGKSTPENGLKLEIKPNDDFTGDSFDVIILSECSRALFDESGAAYADWTTTTTSKDTVSGNTDSDNTDQNTTEEGTN